MLFRYSRCAIRCMEMAHNPGDKCGRGLRNEEVPPSTVTVPVLRAYLGRLVDIHVALIYSVPYYTVYTHTHTHPWLAIFKWETRLRHNGGWRFTSWAVRPTSFLRQITLLTTRFPSRWGVSFETRDFDTRVLPKFLSFRLERSRVWD